MAPKVKGLFKGFKYIAQIFVYKEQELDLEIGYPSDVRHVTHVGWDSSSSNGPSWLSQFKSSSDLSPASLNEFNPSIQSSWTSPDFQRHRRGQSSSSGNCTGCLVPEMPKASKKMKQRKVKASSPVKSRSSSKASFSTAFEEPDEFSDHLTTSYEEPAEMPNQQAAIC